MILECICLGKSTGIVLRFRNLEFFPPAIRAVKFKHHAAVHALAGIQDLIMAPMNQDPLCGDCEK